MLATILIDATVGNHVCSTTVGILQIDSAPNVIPSVLDFTASR